MQVNDIMSAVKTTGLTKRFPRTSGYRDLLPFIKRKWVTAVNNMSLEVRDGEFFGLLGPNGAGKTTLIKMLSCLVLPSSGNAQVFGYDVLKNEQEVKKIVGMVSAEERSFYWRLTGRENLRFYASLYHIPRQQVKTRIDGLLEMVGLTDEADIRFQNYSTGMRQKLAIARGLLSEPKLLFVDEPTRSLDPVSAQSVRQFLKEKVVGDGKTVILATHNLVEAEQLCDRLAIMDHGQVIALGSVKELRSLFQTHDSCKLELKNFREDLLSRINLIGGVLECQMTGSVNGISNLELKISNRVEVLPQIMGIIVTNGVEVCNCQIKELPLEEIFVHALHKDVRTETG
jgi:ABC-2 type transport system ATP-binding protein